MSAPAVSAAPAPAATATPGRSGPAARDASDAGSAFGELLGGLTEPEPGSASAGQATTAAAAATDGEDAGNDKAATALAPEGMPPAAPGQTPGLAPLPPQDLAQDLAQSLLAQAGVAAGQAGPAQQAPAGAAASTAPRDTAAVRAQPAVAGQNAMAPPYGAGTAAAATPSSAASMATVIATATANAAGPSRGDESAAGAAGLIPQMPLPQFAPAPCAQAPALQADAGTAPHQATLACGPHDAAFSGELSAEVQVLVEGGGMQHAQLRLNPAELGPIGISLRLHEQTADISFSAAHAATREGIERALPALREMLSAHGLSLGSADVSTGQGQAGSGPRQEERVPPQPQRGQGGLQAGAPDQPPARLVRAARGMLDLYA